MSPESIFAALNEIKQARKAEEISMLDSILGDLWTMCADLRRTINKNDDMLSSEETKRERVIRNAA